MIEEINRLIARVLRCELEWDERDMWCAADEAWAFYHCGRLERMKRAILEVKP
jgi:hypothetical protein